MRYMPIHLDMRDRIVLVIGGEAAAEAKLRTLIKTEAPIRLIAADVSDEICRWIDAGRIEHVGAEITASAIRSAGLVYAATEDPAFNARIAGAARAANVPVNAADQKAECDFFTPAIIDRSPVTVSVGTEGTSPGLARSIKADIESQLPSDLGKTALKIKSIRDKLAVIMPDFSKRQALWAGILSGKDMRSRLSLSDDELERRFEKALAGHDVKKAGAVRLVGAGPGDPDLLTVGARRALHAADVIVYDRLVSQDVLDLGRREAEYVYVGKTPGGPSVSQDEINRILVKKAQAGLNVVRLKSGDPLIFGRADEEIEALTAVGIAYDIVPGITSAAAAAAEAGLSLTARGHNRAVSLLTGHDAKGFAEQDWKSLAQPGARAAVYMGVGASRFIQGRLILHGAAHDLPVTVVENVSRDNQIVLQTSLSELPEALEAAGIKGPAILLIGYKARSAKTHTLPAQEQVG